MHTKNTNNANNWIYRGAEHRCHAQMVADIKKRNSERNARYQRFYRDIATRDLGDVIFEYLCRLIGC